MTGELAGRRFEVNEEAVLGSHPDVEVRLPADTVSRRHARIWRDDDGTYYLEDLDSSNGTSLDGVPVREREKLGRLNVITVAGEHDLICQRIDDPQTG